MRFVEHAERQCQGMGCQSKRFEKVMTQHVARVYR